MPDSTIVDELLQIFQAVDDQQLEELHQQELEGRRKELERVGAAMNVQGASTDELKDMLVLSGRANATENAKGVLGGKRDELAEELAELSAREVLDGMEKATRLNQMLNSNGQDKSAPLSHAVSGHGKDTDQVSRLVSGRRNDQLNSEARDLREAELLKEEREEELARRKRVLAEKEKQLNQQKIRLAAGKPPNVSDESWKEENQRYQAERAENTKALEKLGQDEAQWKTKIKRQLEERITKAKQALLDAQTTPETHVDLPVPEGVDGHILHQTTVGDDPSNVSGAFSTNQGMLHAVQEGFAQANMLSSYDDQLDRSGTTPTSGRLDEQRFVTNVTGRGDEELGYNLSVEGVSEQRAPKSGETVGLAKDEMEERAKLIQKTGDLKNARIVLDPAYVDGKRVGWNLQTAYANSDAPSDSIDNPQEIAGTLLEAEKIRIACEQQFKRCETEERKKAAAKTEADRKLSAAMNDISFYEQEINKLPVDPIDPKRDRGQLNRAIAQCEKTHRQLETKHKDGTLSTTEQTQWDTATKEKKLLEQLLQSFLYQEQANRIKGNLQTIKDGITKAELELADAQQKLKQAKSDRDVAIVNESKLKPVEDQPKEVIDAPRGDGKAGYDPATGRWEGGRPVKPSGSLKGTDEDNKQLTAHHILPWNQIRDALNSALTGNATKLQEFLDFAEVKVPPWFWSELGKAPTDRSYRFSEVINQIGTDICWSPKNVFMGPLGETRGDDPGEELDTAFVTGGLPTMQSVSGVLTGQTGGIGATPSEFNAQTKDRIEAKYRKKLEKNETDLNKLDAKLQKAMKREMVEAGVWEYVRNDYPNVVAKARKQKQLDLEYEKLVQRFMIEANVTKPELLPKELFEKLLMELGDIETKIKEPVLTASDLTPEELEALEKRMIDLGEGYENAKAEFLKKLGVSSDTELSDTQREQLQTDLFQFKNPKQRLAETMTERAKKPFGADEELPNEARPYRQEEWEKEGDKKVRKKLVKAPPELQAIMQKVDEALELKVTSQTPPLRPTQAPKNMQLPPPPVLIQSDYQALIDKLEEVKKEWTSAVDAYLKGPVTGEVSNAEMLKRYPPALQTSSLIDDRIQRLTKQRDKAPLTQP